MAKLTKTTAFKASVPKQETPMEKTTRIVRKMVDEDAEQRSIKIARLRSARLERQANSPTNVTAVSRKKPPPKKG